MLQNPCKTLGFKKNMFTKFLLGGGGKPYPASDLLGQYHLIWCHIHGLNSLTGTINTGIWLTK